MGDPSPPPLPEGTPPPGAPPARTRASFNLGFGQNVHHHLHEIVRALVEHAKPDAGPPKKKTKAQRLWDLLKTHVHRGFFHSLLGQRTSTSSDFLSLVDKMWTLVHKFASKTRSQSQKDSTTEFVMAGWAKIKAAKHAVERQKASRAIDFGSDGGRKSSFAVGGSGSGGGGGIQGGQDQQGGQEEFQDSSQGFDAMMQEGEGGEGGGRGRDVGPREEDEDGTTSTDHGSATQGRGDLGLQGLTLDTVPNCNISKILMDIAKGLHEQPIDEADFYTVQVHFNRGWKLLLLGLSQAESFARYMAMVALRRAIPVINDTLLDSTTRENLIRVLLNLMISDERSENRLKAVYLLGQLGFYLGTVREHDHLLMMAFKELSKKLLEIQYAEKKKPVTDKNRFNPASRALKIHLIHAIGKYTRFVHKQSRFVEDVVLYMIHEEFLQGDTKVRILKGKGPVEPGKKEPATHVVRALLGVLNNEMKRTEANQKYIGAIFKTYVHPLMRSADQSLQMMAVQFISNWLPITTEDAALLGIETIVSGLKETQYLNAAGFDKAMFKKENLALTRKRRAEESRMAMRSKLLRQLLQIPGTFSKLTPVLGHPHFFIEVNSSMMHTKGIVVNLPVHPKSSVTLTRPLPSIPGVPQAVTTIPPVFMDPLWAEKQKPPQSRYEYHERTGQVPGLPFGYTYAPSALVEVTPTPASKTVDPAKEAREMRAAVAAAQASTAPTPLSRMGTPEHRPSFMQSRPVTRPGLGAGRRPSAMPSIEGPSLQALTAARGRRLSAMQPGTSAPAPTPPIESNRPSRAGSAQPIVPRKLPTRLKDRGEIPPGTARVPQKADTIPGDRRGVPPGFLNVCPFPGYDPDKVDRSAHPVSAIYGKQMGPGKAIAAAPGGGGGKDGKMAFGALAKKTPAEMRQVDADVPEGFTVDRHPVLWPSRIPNLRTQTAPTDFPVNAPVIFDIIQPGTTRLQRVLMRVTSLNKELSAVSVQKDANDGGGISIGETFNIFIRTRQNPWEWVSVNLEVVDDDFEDDVGFAKPKALGSSSGTPSLASLVNLRDSRATESNAVSQRRPTISVAQPGGGVMQLSLPHPAGFTSQGEPYFAPPINMPPLPAGYTTSGNPYFGKTASIKPPPLGMTTQGIRYYPADPKVGIDPAGRNQIAGYDNSGQPFFIPRGCTLPPPAGFTPDGIAYYDIPSLMHQRGVMALPTPAAARADWPIFPEEDEEEGSQEGLAGGGGRASRSGSRASLADIAVMARKKGLPHDHALITAQLVDSLEDSQPGLKQHFLQSVQHAIGTIRRVAEFERLRRTRGYEEEDLDDDANLRDPDDIVAFLRDSDDLAYLRPSGMRVLIEPSALEFQSVHAPLTKSALLRFRAGRGDHAERDFFISVEPVEVFAVKSFHLRLQGEGNNEISVTYYPTAMKSDRVEGSVNLIDETGRKMASCQLVAIRQSFIKVTPTTIDAGWMLPEKRKECFMKVENVSSVQATVSVRLQSEITAAQAEITTGTAAADAGGGDADAGGKEESKRSPFVLPTASIKLQPHEQKFLPVYFEPTNLGRFADVIEINGPGGELVRINVVGIAGIPIALYPEDEENSQAGAAALTRERCEFMKKFSRGDSKDKSHIPLTAVDTAILKNMMSATSDQESRKEAHTMDFGICTAEPQSKMRCLTLMNLGDTPITVGLYPHNSALRCPYLVRVAPRMANTVEVHFTIAEGPQAVHGNFRTAIEVICPEFQNIPLAVRAFVGQPLFFPTWDFAFFKPCRISSHEQLALSLINESHYPLHVVLDNLGQQGGPRDDAATYNYFTSTLSLDDIEPTLIQPFSTIPVNFTFYARERGPLLQTINLRIVKPFKMENLPAAMLQRNLSLVGICIEPYPHRPGEIPDKNGIDFLRMWMSHPKRLLDEYPGSEEKAQRFDTRPRPANVKPFSPGVEGQVVFAKDQVVFRAGAAKTPIGQGDPNIRRSQVQPVQVQNRTNKSHNVLFFASTSFSVDPRAKLLQANDSENVDVIFLPHLDASDLVATYGFAVALVDHDHTFHATQVIAKAPYDFLVYPVPTRENTVIFDFGRVELSTHSLDVNVKHLTLCNTYQRSYSWNVKFVSSKTKYTAFDAGMIMGELQPHETFAVPFRFHADTSGSFESLAELYIKETLDRLAKPIKVVTIILRGHAVNTSMTGLPDSLEFGSTVVFENKRKRFILTNSGTTEAQVTLLTRPPFYVVPKSFQLGPKGQQEIQVTYSPTESRSSSIRMLVFSNQRLYLVLLSGTGGTAELICEKYEKKDVDFGYQAEGTVGWLSLYLTNKGTLPLMLKAVTADNPDLLKLEFVTVTSTVPYEGNQVGDRQALTVSVRRDYWSILRRKFQVFSVLKQLIGHAAGSKKGKKQRRQAGVFEEEGTQFRVHKTGAVNIMEQSLASVVPQLRPFYSYHFRLGYMNKYQAKKDTDVLFHYMPITTDEDAGTLPDLLKSMRIRVVGHVYRQLELFPPFHDFGLAPAEAYIQLDGRKLQQRQLADTYGVMREGQNEGDAVAQLEVLNMSMEAQNLTLQSINPEFTITGRTWNLQPGQKLHIPIEFHPPKEQVQYHGEAKFAHKYGIATIRLAGTGASADLSTDEVVDFGSLKVGAFDTRTLKLHNRGLLDCRYYLEIFQSGSDFQLLDREDEPFEREGVIESGGVESLNIQCCCQSVVDNPARILIRWLRVPRGAWEELTIPLLVLVGMPVFKMQNLELDFRTTYINVNKTLEFTVKNDGNATCNWEVDNDSEVLSVDPESGALEPGETAYIEVTFAPQDFEPLSSSITFFTDAGMKTLMCYGIVGIPYLSIPEDGMFIDFGIVAINKIHSQPVIFTNTGTKPIEYEISMLDVMHDGIQMPPEDFDVFFVNPARGVIEPGAEESISMQTMPREYNSVYMAEWMVRTRDGEQYRGRLSATGGKAIIKIAPPTVSQQEGVAKKPMTAEMSISAPPSRQRPDTAKDWVPNTVESARQAFQNHVENLQEVLAGLRAAELDMQIDHDAEKRPPTVGTPARPGSSRAGSGRRRKDTPEQLAEEEELKRQGQRVFDGSDVRERLKKSKKGRVAHIEDSLSDEEREAYDRFDGSLSRGPQTPSSRRRTPKAPLDVDMSSAVKYMDELSQLEDELEIAIGLRDPAMSPTATTPERQAKTLATGLGRYQPGAPRSRRGPAQRRREKVLRTMLEAQSRPMSALVPDEAEEGVLRAQDLESLKKPIEDILGNAQEMLADANMIADPEVQRTLLIVMNDRILESTKGVIKAVKEQLSNEWIENREFLTSAVRRLQQSTHVMEAIKQAPPELEQAENDFNLGLLRAGDKSNPILLFNLPNVGNLAFDFEIKKKHDERLYPPGFDPQDATDELFQLDPESGTIGPRESVNISATFQARVTGMYQQAYDLISSGDVVLTFTVTARVGSPNIVVTPRILEFGLVSRNKSAVRPLVVANAGSYMDIFRIESLTADTGLESEASTQAPTTLPFVLHAYKGELEPGESVPLQVTFTPPQEGAFNQKFKVLWSKEPIIVEFKGTGGGWRIKAAFLEEADVAFGGLDWGTCVVGCTYEKMFQIKNIGNVEGSVDLSHGNDCFRFEGPRDSNGLIRVPPGQSVDIKAIFWPSQSEVIKEGIQVRLPEQGVLIVPLRATTGVCDWAIDGTIELLNMPVLDIQNKSLKVTNTGSLDIPFEVTVEPEEMASEVGVKVLGLNNEEKLKPGQSVTLEVTVSPTRPMLYDGVIKISTNLGKGSVSREMPFKFRAYREQLALDDQKDVSIGRIMFGDTASVVRALTNFGNNLVKYRVRVEVLNEALKEEGEAGFVEETAAGEKKPPKRGKKGKVAKPEPVKTKLVEDKGRTWEELAIPWKIKGAAEGILAANATANIEAIFESLDEDEGEWHEARLVVEKCDDEAADKWSELSSIKLTGAGGRPKLVIEPSEIDFKDGGVGIRRTLAIIFRNEGTANLSYEVLPEWDWSSCFQFSENFQTKGQIDVDEEVRAELHFTPDQHISYRTEIQVKTPLEVKTIVAKGQGAEYKILQQALPENINFSTIHLGESDQKKMAIQNDCTYAIKVQCDIFKSEPTEGTLEPEKLDIFELIPGVVSLEENPKADPSEAERTSSQLNIRIHAPLPLAPDGTADADAVAQLLHATTQRGFLRLQVLGGASHLVPVLYRWGVKPLVALIRGAEAGGAERILESDKLRMVDFGETPMETGSAMSFVVHNPNSFRINVTATVNDEHFTISPLSGSISAKGFREFSCELKGIDVETEESVPQSETYNGVVEISTNIEALGIISLEAMGTLVDEPLKLEFPEPIAFGPVRSGKSKVHEFTFRNPVRRPLGWKFRVSPEYSDIVQIEGDDQGTAKARQMVTVRLKFNPKQAVDYVSAAYLETDEGNYTLQLMGTGVESAVKIDKHHADFGVVGLNNPEFREIEVTNPTALPLRLGARTSSSSFTTDVKELHIPPGESRKIRVYYNPAAVAHREKGQIAFFNLDDLPEAEERAEMKEQEKERLAEALEAAEAAVTEEGAAVAPEGEAGAPEVPPTTKPTSAGRPRTRPMTGREPILDKIDLEGTGGEYGLNAMGEDGTGAGAGGTGNAISINFPKVTEEQRVRKHFEVENCGDTVIDLGIYDAEGNEISEDAGGSGDGRRISYKISPSRAEIRPKTRQKFTVVVKGLKAGEDKFELSLQTRTLASPKSIPIRVAAKVIGAMEAMADSLKAFSRADTSIEATLSYAAQEEMRYAGDPDIWKLLLPVMRIGPLLPSKEMRTVPMVEPNVNEPDIAPFVIRPPAIPRELPPRAKKWYMNRVSMALDQGAKRAGEDTPEMQRRQQAAQFVQPVEKKVFLERSSRR
ncbi:hypothetical protein HK104_009688 [Borealophlyctis nickersoniae]|nr:hypothetical protein HK104_009688 [Borealophlyctis nickersoniae]